jgi:predicted DNA-binding transcriptional regulator AlpA
MITSTIQTKLLTEKELANWLGVSLPTLQRLRASGGGPRFVRLSQRRLAYRPSDVETWLGDRTTDRIAGEGGPAASDQP